MLVERFIVDTDMTYIIVFLWDNDWIGYPTRFFDFLDETDIL
jgi:hypothetical protein